MSSLTYEGVERNPAHPSRLSGPCLARKVGNFLFSVPVHDQITDDGADDDAAGTGGEYA
jgi:hypothetical protein